MLIHRLITWDTSFYISLKLVSPVPSNFSPKFSEYLSPVPSIFSPKISECLRVSIRLLCSHPSTYAIEAFVGNFAYIEIARIETNFPSRKTRIFHSRNTTPPLNPHHSAALPLQLRIYSRKIDVNFPRRNRVILKIERVIRKTVRFHRTWRIEIA